MARQYNSLSGMIARPLALGAVLLGLSVLPGIAATRELSQYKLVLQPFEASFEELGCSTGEVLSGGYILLQVIGENGQPVPREKLVVVTNAPSPDAKWAIGFINAYEEAVFVDYYIAVLCG